MKQKDVSNERWICLGRIIRPHGVKGALSLKLDNPHSQSLRPGLKVRIERKGLHQEYTVKSFSAGRILFLEGLEDRNEAELFHQAALYVKRSDFPNVHDDEIYLGDMLGFEVIDQDGLLIGTVEGFSDNTAQVLLEVRSDAGVHGMIPFVKPLVVNVDQQAKRIVVDLPLGLFESEKIDA